MRMKVYLAQTFGEKPKYGLLHDSISQIISREDNFEIKDSCDDADCVICIGDLTSEIISYKRQSKRPVIRFLFRSDISNYFCADNALVDYTFWVCDLDINILYPYLQTSTKIEVPFDFTAVPDAGNVPIGDSEFDIYVNTGEFLYPDSALFKILRTLNRLTQLKIDVCSKNSNITSVANPNIRVCDSSDSIETHVKRSKIVIGSGYAVFFAIKHNKPFIVMGERGYGGIPTANNVEQFYHEFFQGTIGGRLDGPLPENLVYEDIQRILQQNFKAEEAIIAKISKNAKVLDSRICDTVTRVVDSCNRVDGRNLCFNTDYTIIKSGDGCYWLLNRYTRKLIARIDKALANKLLTLYRDVDISILTADEIRMLSEQKFLI